VPLRLVIGCGFISATISFVLGVIYLAYKLTFWNSPREEFLANMIVKAAGGIVSQHNRKTRS
jgi:hypothetical protein